MDKPTIIYEEDFLGTVLATDDNTYDGAPDGHNYIGAGFDEDEAKADLLEKLVGSGLYDDDLLLRIMGEV